MHVWFYFLTFRRGYLLLFSVNFASFNFPCLISPRLIFVSRHQGIGQGIPRSILQNPQRRILTQNMDVQRNRAAIKRQYTDHVMLTLQWNELSDYHIHCISASPVVIYVCSIIIAWDNSLYAVVLYYAGYSLKFLLIRYITLTYERDLRRKTDIQGCTEQCTYSKE